MQRGLVSTEATALKARRLVSRVCELSCGPAHAWGEKWISRTRRTSTTATGRNKRLVRSLISAPSPIRRQREWPCERARRYRNGKCFPPWHRRFPHPTDLDSPPVARLHSSFVRIGSTRTAAPAPAATHVGRHGSCQEKVLRWL